jgi:hypothetical protein
MTGQIERLNILRTQRKVASISGGKYGYGGLLLFWHRKNSLAVAREIAKRIDGVLISIPAIAHKKLVQMKVDSVVIVFPANLAQLHGIPPIVERFICKINDLSAKRIFAVVTCYFSPCETWRSMC